MSVDTPGHSVSSSRRRPGRERSTRSIIASSRSRGSKRRRSSSVLSRNVSSSAIARTRNCQRWSSIEKSNPPARIATRMPAVTISRLRATIWLSREGRLMAWQSRGTGENGVLAGADFGSGPHTDHGLPGRYSYSARQPEPMGIRSPESVVGDMNKATQANWKAGLRTTILLATLTGLLVGLGYLIGGPSTALMFLFIGARVQPGHVLVLGQDRPENEPGTSRCPRRRPRACTRWCASWPTRPASRCRVST